MCPSIKRVFCQKAVDQMKLREFFRKNLEGVGFSDLEIQKTPLGTRITIHAARPGLVIGKKGSNVKQLTEELGDKFLFENPQIDVEEVHNPELNAQIMAERLANALERGQHYRRAGYGLLRRIIRSGAVGCEIIISGKITSQRARYQKMKQGIIIKCGEPVKDISYGVAHAKLKAGILGIRVKILPEGYYNPKKISYVGREGLDPEVRKQLLEDEAKEMTIIEEIIEGADVEEVEEEDDGVDQELVTKALQRAKVKGKIVEDDEFLEDDDEGLEMDEEELQEDEEASDEEASDEEGTNEEGTNEEGTNEEGTNDGSSDDE